MLTHRQRIENCLAGQANDRPPVALWRHFPMDDQDPYSLAKSILNYQKGYDFDLVKVTPASSYCLKDWGVDDEWRGATEGTRVYTRRVIHTPEDWRKLKPLHPQQGALSQQLTCLKLLKEELEPATPVIQTIFSPLSQAKNLVGGEQLLVHLRRYPEEVQAGLKIITESTRRFVEALPKLGISGIFYAVQHAQYGLLSEAEYLAFGRSYDLEILESAQSMWLNMLHLHGEEIMFDLFKHYPLQVINWHDRDTAPDLATALRSFPGVLCGGLQREMVELGSAEQVRAQALDSLQVTQGQRFILGTGCVTPITAPHGNLIAVRQSVE
jgi:uroporphyrinogen decarboxylase